MKNYLRTIKALFFSLGLVGCAQPLLASDHLSPAQHQSPQLQVKSNAKKPQSAVEGLPDPVLKAAINAYEWALEHHKVANPYMMAVVDFDMPSYERRLWVIDLRNKHVIMYMHVAQGRRSGKVYATRFSNQSGSHESSPGLFVTVGHQYKGEFGDSLRLEGLEPGINDNAYDRGIIIHSEWYITPHFINHMGYAGRTWGCFAVNPEHIRRLIELEQGGSVFFAYAAPEHHDPLVDHPLSPAGRKLYDQIENINNNPLIRFFEAF